MGSKVRIVHIINSLTFGGAEAMLCSLLERTNRDLFEPHVISLIDDLKLASQILKAGIALEVVGMRPGVPDPRGPIRLIRRLRQLRPTLVQTWMDHSNLIGGLAARAVPGTKVVWGIHHSHHVPSLTKKSTLMTVWACGKLSGIVPAKIVFCSQHARKLYSAGGFAAQRTMVIPNGFNTDLFQPDANARLEIRKELRIDSRSILIGLAARFDPLKDQANFIAAAGLLSKNYPEAHFLMCGSGIDQSNAALTNAIKAAGIQSRCHLLGQRRDVPRIHAALDIATSSSISEAFPLAVGEAMACGVPCVVTDVGDSAMMIGQTGRVVPPSNSPALAAGLAELLKLGPVAMNRLGIEARRRVQELFDLDAVAKRYEELYLELAGAARPAQQKQPSVLETSQLA